MYTVFNLIRNVNTLFNSLNNTILFYKSEFTSRFINLSNGLLETLSTIKNCISCIVNYCDEFHESVNAIEGLLIDLERVVLGAEYEYGNNIRDIDDVFINKQNIINIEDQLNKSVLCESCKR